MQRLFFHSCLLAMTVCMVTSVFAQANFGFKGIGGKIGLIDPEGTSSTIGFGVLANLGSLSENVALEGAIDFWSKSFGSGEATSSFRDLSIGGKAKYLFQSGSGTIKPYAVGGLGVHFLKTEIDIPEQNFGGVIIGGQSSATTTKIGIDLGGGLFYSLNESTDFLAELSYSLISNFNQLAIKVGAVFRLGE